MGEDTYLRRHKDLFYYTNILPESFSKRAFVDHNIKDAIL